MREISINVAGNHWLNPDSLAEHLSIADINENIVLNINAEGPSLVRLGVISALEKHCQQSGRRFDTISVSSWSNNVEKIPFKKNDLFLVSHFFWMSERYHIPPLPLDPDARLFGCFIGRQTPARMMILKDLQDNLRPKCLLSLMKSMGGVSWDHKGIDCEQDMLSPDLIHWANNTDIPSIDGHWVHHQYDEEHNTNRDLLSHYHKFKIEIVLETYTLGDCFFPTEKTVRPIVGKKPMVIYGPKYFLRRMREMGFQTWNNHWDESYDDLEGQERWTAMSEVIKRINEMPDPTIVEKNYEHLSKVIKQYKPWS